MTWRAAIVEADRTGRSSGSFELVRRRILEQGDRLRIVLPGRYALHADEIRSLIAVEAPDRKAVRSSAPGGYHASASELASSETVQHAECLAGEPIRVVVRRAHDR